MEGYIGEVRLVAMSQVPREWLPCDGRLLRIRQNQAMFALLETSFGGDGIETFAVPTLSAPAVGVRYVVCQVGVWPTRRLAESTLGEIRLLSQLGAHFAEQALPCDGRLVTLNQNTALFSLLATRFGGNGTSTFGIPNLQAPTGLRYLLPVFGSFPKRP